jgi:phosphoglycerate dehydrogenase-like enzyme
MSRDPIPEPAISVVPEGDAVLEAAIREGGGRVVPLSAETQGIVCRHGAAAHDALVDALSAWPQVSWVQLPSAGIEAYAHLFDDGDRDWTCAKGAYAEPVAEHALLLILSCLRDLPHHARTRTWLTPRTGRSLFDRRVVLIGGGGIATELLRMLAPFRAHTTVVRRSAAPVAGADRTVTADRLDEVLPEADVVVVAAASTAETARMLDARRLALLPPEAVIVNIARGSLIDTDALVEALAAGRIAAAGLDVTDPEPLPDGHPLWSEPRCVITSHHADTDDMMAPLLARRVRDNVRALREGTPLVGAVDPVAGY